MSNTDTNMFLKIRRDYAR